MSCMCDVCRVPLDCDLALPTLDPRGDVVDLCGDCFDAVDIVVTWRGDEQRESDPEHDVYCRTYDEIAGATCE